MYDLITNQGNLNLKPQVRCLLCRKQCQKGEKLIRGHIWPNSYLKVFTHAENVPASKKIFDVSSKKYGKLFSSGQIIYSMLCQNCENIFSRFEKDFKLSCFDLLHDSKCEFGNNPEEMIIECGNNWLYNFCLSMIFRSMGLSLGGSMLSCGNIEDVYNLLTNCRNLLLNSSLTGKVPKPKIGIFFTPIHVMSETGVSPALSRIVFSKGCCTTSKYSLQSGNELPRNKIDYFFCSIGTINIVAEVSDNCLDLLPSECMVIFGQKKFVVPPAVKRYLFFPRGLLKLFEEFASDQTERILNTPLQRNQKEWEEQESRSHIEHVCSVIAGMSLHSTPNSVEGLLINFLPCPFDRIKVPSTIQKMSSITAVIHSASMSDDAPVTLFKSAFVVIKNEDQSAYALLCLSYNDNKIWTGYSLSVNDYSIKDVLKCNNKEILGQIEETFNTRVLLEEELQKALKKAGFTSMAQLAQWMQIIW